MATRKTRLHREELTPVADRIRLDGAAEKVYTLWNFNRPPAAQCVAAPTQPACFEGRLGPARTRWGCLIRSDDTGRCCKYSGSRPDRHTRPWSRPKPLLPRVVMGLGSAGSWRRPRWFGELPRQSADVPQSALCASGACIHRPRRSANRPSTGNTWCTSRYGRFLLQAEQATRANPAIHPTRSTGRAAERASS